ncbi:MAG: NAD-dependent deacetylase [Clostridia bacterium]
MNSETLKYELVNAKYPVAFTGAGISVASGLPTFDVAWNNIPIRDILTRKYFISYPHKFYDLYRNILSWNNAQPNAAHKVLAQYNASIITQNIDGLHQKAGSQKVLEMHGNLRDLVCEKCRRVYPAIKSLDEEVPYCECKEILKPDVVLFGDKVHDWKQAIKLAEQSDLMLVIGTSLQVFPANLLPNIVQEHHGKVIIINKESENLFKELLH